ncbi:MAG: hypothetical protein KDM81_00875 [Verrucomicrobiae bacterium]|nr:hypothetical protein [Verrucomicrobiae bacterium]MCP5524748.1 hypothetical protein [Verrucomicrobiales bacterium]
MKVEFQNRWVRLSVEVLPELPAIRRYEAVPGSLDARMGRSLRRRLARRMRRTESEVGA